MNVQTARVLKDFELRFLEDDKAAESPVNCAGCIAPCCRGGYRVPLSFEEAQRLPTVFGDFQLNGREYRNTAMLPRHPVTGDCAFVTADGKCSIWSVRPKVCRVYDCRKDSDPQMKAFAAERFK